MTSARPSGAQTPSQLSHSTSLCLVVFPPGTMLTCRAPAEAIPVNCLTTSPNAPRFRASARMHSGGGLNAVRRRPVTVSC